jgi:hypothetical protein
MKKVIIITFIAVFAVINVNAQKYFTKTGQISFFSSTPIENIEAITNSASTVYDSESGKIQWAVLIKSFEFEKALMQEHFNENYMESSKYPKATFKGEIKDFENLNLDKDGTYVVDVVGDLTIHGVTKPIKSKATFKVLDGKITASSDFDVFVADYKIEVPAVVKENIAKEIEISIKTEYELLDRS